MKIKRTEAMIQRAIMDYLETRNDVYFFRANSGSFKTEQGRYVKTGRAGCPDIVVCQNGQFIGLEVKTATGKQSQAQAKAEYDVEAAGGRYYVIRSVGDVKEVLDNLP